LPRRVGVIDLNRLTRVRGTFRPAWRIFIVITFLFLAYVWWAAFNRLEHVKQIPSDHRLQRQLVILSLILLPILGVGSFKKNGFARLTFALITSFILLNLLPLAVVSVIVLIPKVPWSDPRAVFMCVMVVLVVLMFFWQVLIVHNHVLFLSVTPFGRWKAFQNQVASIVLLWSGRWKSNDDETVVETGVKLHPSAGVHYRLIIGVGWIVLSIVCFLLFGLALTNPEFVPAIFHFEFAKAWHMVRHFQATPPEASTVAEAIIKTTPPFSFSSWHSAAWVCLDIF